MTARRASQVHLAQRLSRAGLVPARFAGRCWRAAGALAVLCVLVASPGAAAQVRPADWLMRARQLYNQQQFDQAIAAAEHAVTGLPDRARLVIGRSQLERYRRSSDAALLTVGREALRTVRVDALPPSERLELLLGLGECLYLDNMFGASADLFSSAMGGDAPDEVREAALDWWATSLDRLAQMQPPDSREPFYSTIVDRMQEELERAAGSVAAAYWLAAGARAAGDLSRAWDAALSGWVRAQLSTARGAALREDLDELVMTAIIPERARELAETPADRDKAAAALKAEWDGVKAAWK